MHSDRPVKGGLRIGTFMNMYTVPGDKMAGKLPPCRGGGRRGGAFPHGRTISMRMTVSSGVPGRMQEDETVRNFDHYGISFLDCSDSAPPMRSVTGIIDKLRLPWETQA